MRVVKNVMIGREEINLENANFRRAIYIHNLKVDVLRNKHSYIENYLNQNGVYTTTVTFNEEDDDIYRKLENSILGTDTPFDLVIVYGGDGTLSMVLNILLCNGLEDVPIGIMPAGTCNDFAASIGLNRHVRHCLKKIVAGNIKHVDVGLAENEMYFLSSFAGGNLTAVSYSTGRSAKRLFGRVAYYCKSVFNIRNMKTFHVRITGNNGTIEADDALLYALGNGRQIAGMRKLNKDLQIDEGNMNVVVVRKCAIVVMVYLFVNALFLGVQEGKHVKMMRVNECEIKVDTGVELTIDGEKYKPKDTEGNIALKVLQRQVKVFC